MSAALEIVIPAYKGTHLAATLESLARQTDRSSTVHLVDDASPDNLAAIADAYRHRIDLRYTRHSRNLGARSLAAAWNRAITQASAPWLWVLADDDIASPECVATLRANLGNGPSLWRFAVDEIDHAGHVTRQHPAPPALESARQLFDALTPPTGRFCCLSDHVFRRDALGPSGFIDLPCGFFSDFAAWLTCSLPGGVATLPAGRVGFRIHPGSLSGRARHLSRAKIRAAFAYVHWIRTTHLRRLDASAQFPVQRAASFLSGTLDDLQPLGTSDLAVAAFAAPRALGPAGWPAALGVLGTAMRGSARHRRQSRS